MELFSVSIWWVVTLAFILSSLLSNPSKTLPSCPLGCQCATETATISINCSGLSHTRLPDLSGIDLTPDTSVDLYLSGNQYSHVLLNSLSGINGHIRVLDVLNNSNKIFISDSFISANKDSIEILKLDNVDGSMDSILEMLLPLSKIRELDISPNDCQPVDLVRLLALLISLKTLKSVSLRHCGTFISHKKDVGIVKINGVDIVAPPPDATSPQRFMVFVNTTSYRGGHAKSQSSRQFLAFYDISAEGACNTPMFKSELKNNPHSAYFRLSSRTSVCLHIMDIPGTDLHQSKNQQKTEDHSSSNSIENKCSGIDLGFETNLRETTPTNPDSRRFHASENRTHQSHSGQMRTRSCRCRGASRSSSKGQRHRSSEANAFCKDRVGRILSSENHLVNCLLSGILPLRFLNNIYPDVLARLYNVLKLCFLHSAAQAQSGMGGFMSGGLRQYNAIRKYSQEPFMGSNANTLHMCLTPPRDLPEQPTRLPHLPSPVKSRESRLDSRIPETDVGPSPTSSSMPTKLEHQDQKDSGGIVLDNGLPSAGTDEEVLQRFPPSDTNIPEEMSRGYNDRSNSLLSNESIQGQSSPTPMETDPKDNPHTIEENVDLDSSLSHITEPRENINTDLNNKTPSTNKVPPTNESPYPNVPPFEKSESTEFRKTLQDGSDSLRADVIHDDTGLPDKRARSEKPSPDARPSCAPQAGPNTTYCDDTPPHHSANNLTNSQPGATFKTPKPAIDEGDLVCRCWHRDDATKGNRRSNSDPSITSKEGEHSADDSIAPPAGRFSGYAKKSTDSGWVFLSCSMHLVLIYAVIFHKKNKLRHKFYIEERN